MQKATGWLRNGFEFAISSTEARKFGQIVLQALVVPLPCTCQHHLGSTILKQSDSRIFGKERAWMCEQTSLTKVGRQTGWPSPGPGQTPKIDENYELQEQQWDDR